MTTSFFNSISLCRMGGIRHRVHTKENNSTERVPAQNNPCNADEDQDNNCDDYLQIWYPFALFLFLDTPWSCTIAPAGRSHSTTFAVRDPDRRKGFFLPGADIHTIMVGREPAFITIFPATILAGERENDFISTMIAPGHYCSVGDPGNKNSSSCRTGGWGNPDPDQKANPVKSEKMTKHPAGQTQSTQIRPGQ